MLWDVDKMDVACNESYEIIKFLNSWQHTADINDIDLYPSQFQKEIEEWNRIIYPSVNNGVYRYLFIYF